VPRPSARPLAALPAGLPVDLLARLFESLPLVCPNCGAMLNIGFITEAAPVEQILTCPSVSHPARPSSSKFKTMML